MAGHLSFEKVFRKRIVFLTILFLFCMLMIVLRLAYMQIWHQNEYQAMADGQRTKGQTLWPTRGEIRIWDSFTNQPYTVATTDEKVMVFVNASAVVNKDEVTNTLADILKIDKNEIAEKIADSSKKYVVIKKSLTDAEQEQIKAANLTGIGFDSETARLYPEGAMLAQLLGFVGFQGDKRAGSYGLELAFEKQLAGIPGYVLQEKDNSGRWIFGAKRDRVPATDGDSLMLTIDKTIQLQVDKILKQAVTDNQADSGSVIVMDPKTGAVLSMSTYPDFNLNEYSKVENPSIYINQITQGAYEPGSIFKPLTIAAAVNEGKINANTTYVDTGSVEIDGYTIKNSDEKAHGTQTMSQVLEESLNTGTIFAKDTIGNKKFNEYVERFGFGKKVGFEVMESPGDLGNLKGNIKVNYHTASFGQGISVTPLQMVQAFSALANGGEMVKPYVVKEIIRQDGKVEEVGKTQATQVISARAASEVAAMLVNVVEKGHGKRAGVPGYYIAGKTGTAQVPRKDGKGYEENNNIGSFIGFGPVEDPRFVILVRINHPRTVKFAETTAAPAFGQIAQFLLQHYKISPTRK